MNKLGAKAERTVYLYHLHVNTFKNITDEETLKTSTLHKARKIVFLSGGFRKTETSNISKTLFERTKNLCSHGPIMSELPDEALCAKTCQSFKG